MINKILGPELSKSVGKGLVFIWKTLLISTIFAVLCSLCFAIPMLIGYALAAEMGALVGAAFGTIWFTVIFIVAVIRACN